MARKKMWVRHDKASRELGYSPGPVPAALRRAVEWFRSNGYVNKGYASKGSVSNGRV